MLESLFNKLYYKQTSTQVFYGEICEIFSNMFLLEHPPPAASVFSKDFFDIGYENSHTRTKRLYVSAAYLFFKNIPFWFAECISLIDGTLTLANYFLSVKEFTLRFLYRLNQPLWKIHGIA